MLQSTNLFWLTLHFSLFSITWSQKFWKNCVNKKQTNQTAPHKTFKSRVVQLKSTALNKSQVSSLCVPILLQRTVCEECWKQVSWRHHDSQSTQTPALIKPTFKGEVKWIKFRWTSVNFSGIWSVFTRIYHLSSNSIVRQLGIFFNWAACQKLCRHNHKIVHLLASYLSQHWYELIRLKNYCENHE